MKRVAFFAGLILATVVSAETKELSVGGFIDAYYGFDFNEPTGDRAFTTHALRHNEFTLNLAYVDLKIEKPKAHGRLALQAGTSVFNNYSGERTQNAALGGILQHIQEAYGGYKLSEGLWLDAGIFLSHIGAESFISKDDWNYTRSLGADFSPYYQAGVRLNYQADPKWLLSLHVLNGWQNIIDNNSDKSIGMQIAYSASDILSFTYNNLIGREQEFRVFNNFIVKAKITDGWSLSFSSDLGFQKKPGSGDYSIWYVETLLTQFRLSEALSLGGRLEYFNDKDQVVVATGTPNGFQTSGASLNLDWQPESYILIRNEVRSLFATDSIFPGKTGPTQMNMLFVTSLGLSF